MKYLGIMNGWKETPAEYTKHLAECGTEYETTICYMEYPEEGGCIKRQRQEMRKRYDLTTKRSGTYSVKTEETCNECGCSWESWTQTTLLMGGKGPGGPTPYEGGKNKWSFSEKMLKYLLTFVDIYNILKV